ncbi:tetratricopeptide repeat protein [Marinomonas sp.]|nr:tetratricopeptide repeat protein [Marinomonas sp.]MDB4836914.1 tetratricopeptide repeat protein [Marinomonas sp.]
MDKTMKVALVTGAFAVITVLLTKYLPEFTTKSPEKSTTFTTESSGSNATINNVNVNVNVNGDQTIIQTTHTSISLKKYEQSLSEREAAIKAQLEEIHITQLQQQRSISDERLKQKTILEIELTALQEKLGNIESAYQTLQLALKASSASIETLKEQVPEEQLKKVKQSIEEGNAANTSAAFKNIVDSNSSAMAEAAYQAAKLDKVNLNYADALIYFRKAVMLEESNSDYLIAYANMLDTLADHAKAIEYYELALASDLITYGEEHPNVARTRNNLGSAYYSLGDYSKAIEYLELALASDLITYGEDHSSVATRRNNLGSAYDSLGDYPKAIEHLELALRL